MIRPRKISGQKGFTIIELLISTAVLSTILVTVTIIMINIGNLYYKGVNQARVQDAARNITDEISQRLQLNSQPQVYSAAAAPNGSQAYCVGTTRYTYVLGVQIGTRGPGTPPPSGIPFQHVLWRDTVASADNCVSANLTAANPSLGSDAGGVDAVDGTELIASDSRLFNFSISPSTSPYTLRVGVAYGADDLFCSSSVPNSCTTAAAMGLLSNYTNGNLNCKGSISHGDQFCSTSNLSTTVVQRLTTN